MFDDWELPITDGGVVRLSLPLRETYLSPEVDGGECVVQSTGRVVSAWFDTGDGVVRVSLVRDTFNCSRPYRQSVYRWGFNVSRWQDGLVVSRDGDKPTVTATVTELDGDWDV